MVNIMAYIKEKKNQFKDFQVVRKTKVIEQQTMELQAERARQQKIADANKERDKVQKDLAKITTYNKEVEGPSKIMMFGQGLAKTINRGADKMKRVKIGGGNLGGGGVRKDLASISKGSSLESVGVSSDPFPPPPRNESPFMTLKGSPFRKGNSRF